MDNPAFPFSLYACGDSLLVLEVAQEIGGDAFTRVQAAMRALREARIEGVAELVPAYTSIGIHLTRPFSLEVPTLSQDLEERLPQALSEAKSDTAEAPKTRVHRLPVCYGGEYGPDLTYTSQELGLAEDELIERHSAVRYRVYQLGFAPGFCFLGDLDPLLVLPRRAEPRTQVPAGSVAIAARQTGVYPMASPGGWHLLGRTPLTLFKPGAEEPFLLSAGDWVVFDPIDAGDFQSWTGRNIAGKEHRPSG